MAEREEKSHHKVREIINKYMVKVTNQDPFEKRLNALEDFYDPENENIGKITDEYRDLLVGDPTEGSVGMLQKPYKKLEELFQYDKTTKTAKKKKLNKDEVEEFFDHHIELLLSTVAFEELDEIKKQYKDDKDGFRKHMRTLYNQITGRDGQNRERIENVIKVYQDQEVDYRAFRENYRNLVDEESQSLTQITIGSITGHLIHPTLDRLNMAKKVHEKLKEHPNLESVVNPYVVNPHINSESYLAAIYPSQIEGIKTEKLRKEYNLKFKKKAKKKEEKHK